MAALSGWYPGRRTISLTMPQRCCQVSAHAVLRYRERFENVVNAGQVLAHRFNCAKNVTSALIPGRTSLWVVQDHDMLLVVKMTRAFVFVIVTCMRVSGLDAKRYARALKKVGKLKKQTK